MFTNFAMIHLQSTALNSCDSSQSSAKTLGSQISFPVQLPTFVFYHFGKNNLDTHIFNQWFSVSWLNEGKGKDVPVHAMKAYRGAQV
jgi:hypothetical protein